MDAELDIIIPVYNEGRSIHAVLASLAAHVDTKFRVLIGYDHDEDDTLAALAAHPVDIELVLVKNRGRGAFGAVTTCFEESRAPYVLVFPADDDYNAPRIDELVAKARQGAAIVAASRFLPGGCMVGCPWLKRVLIRTSAVALRRCARLPCHDPSNGLRLFTQHTLRTIPLESSRGFAYSIELLVKAHRLGWKIDEVPFAWYERKQGQSRFQVVRWVPAYLRWFFYAFETTWLGKGPTSVRTRPSNLAAPAASSHGPSPGLRS